MKKITKLRLCDWTLLAMTVVMLGSAVQLEVTSGQDICWVWGHVVLGIAFMMLVCWHLQLHFNWGNWFVRLKKQKSHVTKWLAVLAVLTLVSAIVATGHWIGEYAHSSIGGVHGKIGFVFIALAIGHTVKRIKFFKRR